MNFKEYWKKHKELYTQLGVTEAAAYKIWCDAVDAIKNEIYMEYQKNRKKK